MGRNLGWERECTIQNDITKNERQGKGSLLTFYCSSGLFMVLQDLSRSLRESVSVLFRTEY